ncbi:transcription elongation factor Elf1 like-domain-containing protein [Gilbertella persicaria]|uniref:transcription elongation factor Elf1 like-domain-containing protein n=1 Tax=Gilbertella persicaria TaxID=101096 RepID=UPI0022208466|nr:transcription elongation factor Elf1 like-domain-containing protein [Gilbertella persicaria]KAI8058975.1 transcription elongation factor Elf1 like-domain-containing protein [Gilbertella persicaria]
MGKRKSNRKPQKKLKEKLDTTFNCLFCNHENSIDCKIDQQNKVGILTCKICDVNWQTTITYLDEPVDVYSAWIDACEEVNRQKRLQAQRARTQRNNSRSPSPVRQNYSNQLDPFDDDDEEEDEDY